MRLHEFLFGIIVAIIGLASIFASDSAHLPQIADKLLPIVHALSGGGISFVISEIISKMLNIESNSLILILCTLFVGFLIGLMWGKIYTYRYMEKSSTIPLFLKILLILYVFYALFALLITGVTTLVGAY